MVAMARQVGRVRDVRGDETIADAPEDLRPQYQYVWSARYIDAPILRDENTDGDEDCIDGSDERLYYLTDANFNVTCLIDDGGDAVERYVYDAYGTVTILDGSTGGQTDWATDADQVSDVDNSILYCGYYRDAETHLDCVRLRYRHPYLAWIQRDPIGYPDGMNLYEYVQSTPTRGTDPFGLEFSADDANELAKDLSKAYKQYKDVRDIMDKAQSTAEDVANISKMLGGTEDERKKARGALLEKYTEKGLEKLVEGAAKAAGLGAGAASLISSLAKEAADVGNALGNYIVGGAQDAMGHNDCIACTQLKLTDFREIDGNLGKRNAADSDDKSCNYNILSKEPPHGYHRSNPADR